MRLMILDKDAKVHMAAVSIVVIAVFAAGIVVGLSIVQFVDFISRMSR